MSAQRPSRLPSVYAGVSRCPICGYSLRDLGPACPCPECGSVIDVEVLTSPEMHDAVAATKVWCTLGIIGWAISSTGYWAYNMVVLEVMNGYYPGIYGPNHYAGVWCRTAVVVAPIALACSWHRHALRNIYQIALRDQPRTAKTPKRVIAANVLGLLLGLFGCVGILALVSAAN